MRPLRSIFLIGYRGTGKSTVARLLAAELGCEWVDSDDLVEQQTGRSIAELFAEQGEPAFRDEEAQVVADLCAGPPRVVALGGGAVLRQPTRQRLADQTVVWLTASPQTLRQRLEADLATTARRPGLTSAGPLNEIEQVLAERAPLYGACATFIVDTENISPEAVASAIVDRLSLPDTNR